MKKHILILLSILIPAISWGIAAKYIDADGIKNPAHTKTWAMPAASGTLATTASGASILLDNLGTTAINAGLIPASPYTISLGTTTARWANLYGVALKYDSNVNINLQTRSLFALTSNALSLNWEDRVLYSPNGSNEVVNWGNGTLGNPTTGAVSFDWGTSTTANDNKSKKLSNVVDPASAQDAATKNYVDTHTFTDATNSTNIAITNDTTTNATMYPTWVTTTTGNLPAKVSSTKMTFNPSTGMLTTTGITSALTGNASTATVGTTATTTTKSDNVTYYPTFVAANSSSNQGLNVGPLTYNPSTGAVTSTTFVGAVTGTATGNSIVTYTAQTSTYSAAINDLVDCTTGTFTVTLPTAVGQTGKFIEIMNSGTGVITLNTTSAQTISGSASGALTLPMQYERVKVVSDNANWKVVNHDYPQAVVSFTPTATGFTSSTGTWYGNWSRFGSKMEIDYRYESNNTQSGTLSAITMPSGYTIDTAKTPNSSTSFPSGVPLVIRDAGAGTYFGIAFVAGSTSFNVNVMGVTGSYADGGNVTSTVPMTWASTDTLAFKITVPVVGWW